MKNLLSIALIAMSCAQIQAQNVYHLKYKSEITKSNYGPVKVGPVSELDIRSNADYATMTTTYVNERDARMSSAANVGWPEILDYKNNTVIYLDNENKYFRIETVDSAYRGKMKFEEQADVTEVNGHKCYAYRVKADDLPNDDLEVTLWVNKNVKVYPKLNPFFLRYMGWYYFPGLSEVPGLVERIDSKQKVIAKKVIESSWTLVKSSETELKADDVKLPWLDKSFSPAIKCQETRTGKDGKTTMIVYASTKEEGEKYVARMQKLYHKVTGQQITDFKCFGGRNR
jgi:hypothetical protein